MSLSSRSHTPPSRRRFLKFNETQLEAAIAVGDYLVVCAEYVLSLQHATTNPRRELERRILAAVTAAHTTTRRAVSKQLWRHDSHSEEFNKAFDSLAKAGQIYVKHGLKGRVSVSIDPFEA